MAWRRSVGLVLNALAVALAACGGEVASKAAPVAPPSSAPTVQRAHVGRSAAPETTPALTNGNASSDADLWAAADALRHASDIGDEAERRRVRAQAEATLAAAGSRAIPVLVAALRDLDRAGFDPTEMFAACGPEAIEPLCAELADPMHPWRGNVVQALGWAITFPRDLATEAQFGARALVACADEYRGGGDGLSDDEIAADEERAELATDALEQLYFARSAAGPCADDIARMWVRWVTYDADLDARHQALRVLTELGTDAASALPIVLAHLKELDPDTTEGTEQVLRFAGRVGAAAPEALPLLAAYLDDEQSSTVRAGALNALRTWGDAAPELRPRLVALLEDPDEDVRTAAAYAVASQPGGALDAWRVLAHVAAESGGWGYDGDWERGMLAPALRDDSGAARILDAAPGLSAAEVRQVARAIREYAPERAGEWVARLATHSDPAVRAAALGACCDEGRPTATLLRALLDDGEASVRAAAARVAWALGGPQLREAARARLIEAARSPDSAVRDRAVEQLAEDSAGLPRDVAERVSEPDRRLAEALLEFWHDPRELHDRTRFEWQELGPHLLAARPPVPRAIAHDALVLFCGGWPHFTGPVLEDPSLPSQLADAVERAAVATGDETAEARRKGAARLLAQFPIERAMALLTPLSQDASADVRQVAVESLAEIETRAPGSVPVALARAALQERDGTEDAVFGLLRAMRTRATEVREPLRALARDGVHGPRERAAAALWRIDGDVSAAADVIREFLVWCPSQAPEFPDVADGTWDDARDVMLAAPVRPGDLQLALDARIASRYSLIVPLLARHGPAAAPAVPWLRGLLLGPSELYCGTGVDYSWGTVSESNVEIARTLLAIGPAALAALPELRQVVAREGDRDGVVRDIIRRLEAMR